MLNAREYVDDQGNLIHVLCDSANCACRTHAREEVIRAATEEEKACYEAGEGFRFE